MKIFELCGEKIEFKEKHRNGIFIGKFYRCIFKKLSSDFLLFYDNADQSEEEYWEDLNKEIIQIIDKIFKIMVMSMEKKEIPKEDISNLNYMGIFRYWIPVFERIDDEYNSIFMDEEQRKYYRQVRKEMRGRFVGGGVGLEGALKGMATAGALNAATGAAHSVFNFAGSVRDRLKQLNKIEKLFGNSLRKEILGVFEDTIQLAYSTEVELLKEYGFSCKKFQLFYTDKEIPEEEFEPKAFKNEPFNINLYKKALKIPGIVRGELENIAEYTGMDIKEIR